MKLPVIKKLLLVMVLLLPLQAIAKAEVYTSFFSNLAIGGFDTVAYHSENKPVKGNSDFSVVYKDVKWQFSSQENLDKFNGNPQAYAPQFGGYCAWAVAMNDTAKGDPKYWSIVDGKLYLNYDAEIKLRWEKNIAGFIQKANQNWPGVLD